MGNPAGSRPAGCMGPPPSERIWGRPAVIRWLDQQGGILGRGGCALLRARTQHAGAVVMAIGHGLLRMRTADRLSVCTTYGI